MLIMLYLLNTSIFGGIFVVAKLAIRWRQQYNLKAGVQLRLLRNLRLEKKKVFPLQSESSLELRGYPSEQVVITFQPWCIHAQLSLSCPRCQSIGKQPCCCLSQDC